MALTKVIGAGIGTVTNQFADANMATGTPVQIVQSTVNTASTTTSTSFGDVGLSAAITPSSTSNKVLVTVVLGKVGQSNTNGSQ